MGAFILPVPRNGEFACSLIVQFDLPYFLTSDLSPLVFNAMGELNSRNLPRSGAKPDEDFMAEYLLVSFKTCPWVQRSAISLREKNTPFEFRHIERDNRPAGSWPSRRTERFRCCVSMT